MKGIEKNKHEHLMKCLEELHTLTEDSGERKLIEEEISTLSDSFDWYNSLMAEIHTESDHYNSLYTEVQRRIYKELRRVRRIQKK